MLLFPVHIKNFNKLIRGKSIAIRTSVLQDSILKQHLNIFNDVCTDRKHKNTIRLAYLSDGWSIAKREMNEIETNIKV